MPIKSLCVKWEHHAPTRIGTSCGHYLPSKQANMLNTIHPSQLRGHECQEEQICMYILLWEALTAFQDIYAHMHMCVCVCGCIFVCVCVG